MPQTAQFGEYGDLDVLHVVEVPAPAPGPGQVRIAVHAAGVNPIEWKIVAGFMRDMRPLALPAGLGSDVAGIVDQTSPGVTKEQTMSSLEMIGREVIPALRDESIE